MARDGSLICRRIKRQNLSRNGEGGLRKSRSRKRVAFTSIIFLFHLYLDVVHGKKKKSENSLGVDEFSMAKRKEKTDSTARFPFFFSFPCCLLGKRNFFLSRALATQFICFLNRPKCWAESERCVFFFLCFSFSFFHFPATTNLFTNKKRWNGKALKAGKTWKKKTCLAFCSNYECSCRSLRCSFVCIGKASAMFNDRDAHVDALDGTLMTHAAFGEHLRDRRDR